ncbi:MAG TPA: hypothetical protein VJZ75_10400 [Candidatus Bathyarchaeia archaeon]|nr:hypothetical protein [Candidatus Bathyarchaeia archaeon]
MSGNSPLKEADREAIRIIERAQENGLTLRLIGGIAIKVRCKSAQHRALARDYADIDFVGCQKQRKQLKSFIPELGYQSRELFNAMQGERLIFNDMKNTRRLDIFLNKLNMCHKFDFKNRLQQHELTLSPADLLMTKIQVVEATEKEVKDILALMLDFPIVEKDEKDAINGVYVASICADDWGIYKTFTINIDKILQLLPSYMDDSKNTGIVKQRLEELRRMIIDAPKSASWKLRSVIGEKKRWYELPEADRAIVNSKLVQDATKLRTDIA